MTQHPQTPPPPPSGGGGFFAPNRGGALISPTSPPRDPVLILILNLLLGGGAGSILIGQKTKGIVVIVLFLAVGIPTCFAGSGLIALAAAIDGYLQARSLEEGHPIAQWTFFNEHR